MAHWSHLVTILMMLSSIVFGSTASSNKKRSLSSFFANTPTRNGSWYQQRRFQVGGGIIAGLAIACVGTAFAWPSISESMAKCCKPHRQRPHTEEIDDTDEELPVRTRRTRPKLWKRLVTVLAIVLLAILLFWCCIYGQAKPTIGEDWVIIGEGTSLPPNEIQVQSQGQMKNNLTPTSGGVEARAGAGAPNSLPEESPVTGHLQSSGCCSRSHVSGGGSIVAARPS